MKTSIKTLTLSVKDLAQIIAVEDPETRQRMLELLSNPESVNELEPTPEEAPAAEILVKTIRKKSAQIARRRQVRQRRIDEKAITEQKAAPAAQAEPARLSVEIPWNMDALNFVNFVKNRSEELDRNFRRFFRMLKQQSSSTAIIELETRAMNLLDIFKNAVRSSTVMRSMHLFPNQTLTISGFF